MRLRVEPAMTNQKPAMTSLVIPDLIRDPVHRDRDEIAGVFDPEGALQAWCGSKSGLKSSRSPSETWDRDEIAGVFDPEGASQTW